MTKIYLIRHAEAEGNLYRLSQGHYDAPLTNHGWRQLSTLRQRFSDIHIDAVYSSDLFRARATASAIAFPKNLPIQSSRALREIYVGEWEGKTWVTKQLR